MHKPLISLIAAMDENRGIGKNNQLLFRIPEDLKRFKQLTLHHPVIMGRKTFESIGRPLPNRFNTIITRDATFQADGCTIAHSLDEAIIIAKQHNQEEIFVIGGGQIYQQAIKYADKLYLTVVKGTFDADAFFPDYSAFQKIVFQQEGQYWQYSYTFFDLLLDKAVYNTISLKNMKKALIVLLCVLAFAAGSVSNVSAFHNPHGKDQIPEKNGTYDDPDHPGIKVRVFVHPEKPEQATNTVLVCGLEDPDSGTVVHAEAWHLPPTVTYNLNPGSVPASVGGTNLPTIAANGFADWVSASANKVAFTKGADTTVARTAYDGRNIVAWGRTSGTALGVTYIRYYTSNGLVVDVDTIMNKKFSWKWSNSNVCADSASYDAENILTHELGHWLGLDDEYDAAQYGNATMYGYGSKGEVKKNTLTTGDNQGAHDIYN